MFMIREYFSLLNNTHIRKMKYLNIFYYLKINIKEYIKLYHTSSYNKASNITHRTAKDATADVVADEEEEGWPVVAETKKKKRKEKKESILASQN